MVLTLVTPPIQEPVSLAEVKEHLRVMHNLEDSLIAAQLAAAREDAESFLGRALLEQTWELCLDAWPDAAYIQLPRPPLKSVTSVVYTDHEGTAHTLDPATEYTADTRSEPGRVVLRFGRSWPTATLAPANPIVITYKAGYASVTAVPAKFKHAIKVRVAELYSPFRDGVIIGRGVHDSKTFQRLLYPDRVFLP